MNKTIDTGYIKKYIQTFLENYMLDTVPSPFLYGFVQSSQQPSPLDVLCHLILTTTPIFCMDTTITLSIDEENEATANLLVDN